MRPKRKPLLSLMIKRAVFFLATMGSLTVFLYGIGTAQDFLESTQLGLLRLSAAIGILLFLGALFGLMLDVFHAAQARAPRLLWGAFAYLFALLFGAAIALFSNGILVLATGNLA